MRRRQKARAPWSPPKKNKSYHARRLVALLSRSVLDLPSLRLGALDDVADGVADLVGCVAGGLHRGVLDS